MNRADIVKTWRIAGDLYLTKDDKVRIKTETGLVEGILKDVNDKGPVVSIGLNTLITIAIGDIDWITAISDISYGPGDRICVDMEDK